MVWHGRARQGSFFKRAREQDMSKRALSVKLIGTLPLIMHNPTLLNRSNPFTQRYEELTAKRGKTRTTSQNEELQEIEFKASVYVENGNVVIPDESIEAAMVAGARDSRQGKVALPSIMVQESPVLKYKGGPKTLDELWESQEFRYQKLVRVQSARILRTRAWFKEWSADVTILWEDEIVKDENTVLKWLKVCGLKVGLLERRPRFGLFRIENNG
jgi:hypothetical protein